MNSKSALSTLSRVITIILLTVAMAQGVSAQQTTPTVTILHNFSDGSVANDGIGQDGSGSLIQASDGNFYGMCDDGGAADGGVIFQTTPSGTVTILHSFGDGSVANDGVSPFGGLIQAFNGNFYGTTTEGGAGSEGVIFQMTPSGTVTILHSFGDGSVANDGVGLDGSGSLIQASDGNFYGMCDAGGSASHGVIFQMTPSGVVTILHSFGDGGVANDGESPFGSLIQASDGSFYGITDDSELVAGGVIFNISLGLSITNPSITFSSDLQFFSLPYTYPGIGLDSLFGYSGVNLASWLPGTGSYAMTPTPPSDQIAIGQGYWARFPNQISITASGTPADTTQNFPINLTPGWNMVGDPFTNPVPITSLLFQGGTMTYSQATNGNAPLVGPIFWKYDTSSNSYVGAPSLEPEGGYWVYAFSGTDMQVPHP
jgi:uncharacterized repeat protein (TIGR03803 family)